MTNTAYQIWETFKAELTQPATDDMKEALASALREVINQLQYDNADWQEPNDSMIIDAQKLYELSYDMEAL
jgi:hypothetical protein